MKVLKKLSLFFMLGVPVLVYLFLQGFGKNQFDIPIYYQEGIDTVVVDCGTIKMLGQYHASTLYTLDTEFEISNDIEDGIIIYDMSGIATADASINSRNNMLSFINKFKDEERIGIISVVDSISSEVTFDNQNLTIVPIKDRSIKDYYARCILLLNMGNPNLLVLVDDKRRIRGYFDTSQLEEIDRLNTELYILLEGEYEQ